MNNNIKYPFWSGKYSVNQTGTILRRRIFKKEEVPIFEFWNDIEDPLTLHISENLYYQPFRHFDAFDFGSVPLILQSFVSPLCAPKSFALHDSNYEFHAVWINGVMTEIDRSRADNLLKIGMKAENRSTLEITTAYYGVKWFGEDVWKLGFDTDENIKRMLNAMDNINGTEDIRKIS